MEYSCPRSVADSNNYLQPAMSGFDVVTSTVIFVNYYDVLKHAYLETFKDLRLGFSKRPYLRQSMEITTHGDPLKKMCHSPAPVSVPME